LLSSRNSIHLDFDMRTTIIASVLSLFAVVSGNAQDNLPFDAQPVTSFDEPWALPFLPDGRMLVTEKKGRRWIVTQNGEKSPVRSVPDVDYGGQGDVALHPDYAQNGLIYLQSLGTVTITLGSNRSWSAIKVTVPEPSNLGHCPRTLIKVTVPERS
jgi:hypothetical protein